MRRAFRFHLSQKYCMLMPIFFKKNLPHLRQAFLVHLYQKFYLITDIFPDALLPLASLAI